MGYYSYESRSKFVGTISTIGSALFLFLLGSYISISATEKLQDPVIEIAFDREELPEPEPPQIKVEAGREPRTEKPEPTQPVKLVQKSESPTVAKRPNVSKETTVGNKGDVEVPEPPREKPIEQRALFSSAHNSNKDTVAQQVANKVSNSLKAGHPEGNTDNGNPEGEPSAKLEGRTVVGSLPRPVFESGDGGKVVVKIVVNREGKVISAVAGAPGTTISDSVLRERARKAALGAHFNVSGSAPEAQEGTITYVFRVK